jgi:putative flavoprotein involved in K+ transport
LRPGFQPLISGTGSGASVSAELFPVGILELVREQHQIRHCYPDGNRASLCQRMLSAAPQKDTRMQVEKIDTLVVGAGQAGLAMSEHLQATGTDHIVLERNRIAERWRTERWASLVANGPAWHDRFPSKPFADVDPDGFAPRQSVVDYFVDFAAQIKAPVRCGVEVTDVQKKTGHRGFRILTSHGVIEAVNVIAATGPFQHPVIPALVPDDTGLFQIHSSAYRTPEQLPAGAVLVVGAGSSGGQIADELLRAGRRVYLSVGPHDRPPRRYRGRDFCWWLGVLGKWDAAARDPGTQHVTISVSGARGGETVDFRSYGARGMTLVGRTMAFRDGVMQFAPDLSLNLERGDANYLSVLNEADAYVVRNGLDLPQEPSARVIAPDPPCVTNPVRQLDLAAAGITTILWATGYRTDYSWLDVDVFDAQGQPQHQRGVSTEPGIYFLGLPWQSRRGSAFIWGVWHDAKYLADHIATQHSYRIHHEAAQNLSPDTESRNRT